MTSLCWLSAARGGGRCPRTSVTQDERKVLDLRRLQRGITKMSGNLIASAFLISTLVLAGSAWAGEPADSGTLGGDEGSGSAGAEADGADASGHDYPAATLPMSGELGVLFGVIAPAGDHNLHAEDREPRPLRGTAMEFGLRAGMFPLTFAGAEIEGALAPTSTKDGMGATLWAFRAHAVAQLPLARMAPFILVGGGRLGVFSNSNGNDSDPLLHFGAGVKVGLSELLSVRIDGRDNLTQKAGTSEGSLTHHPEVLAGVTVRWYAQKKTRRAEPVVEPSDIDEDGIVDPDDRCPREAGDAPDGCPPDDSDGDGFVDEVDRCPNVRGQKPDGCPIDQDKDGFADEADDCPDVAGTAPDGCPTTDTDGDGILDHLDTCAEQPETANGYEDQDGCPDELPEAVRKFAGVITGIQFETGKSTIAPKSTATLDEAVRVLSDYPAIRIRIVGHTDNVGKREDNLALSQRRADAVREYMLKQGIEGQRIEALGAGPDQPQVSNDSAAGRRTNRRIEFVIIGQAGAGKKGSDSGASDEQ